MGDGQVFLWLSSSCEGVCYTDSILLVSQIVKRHYLQHGPLGNRRISNAPKPISSDLKLGKVGSRSHIQNLNQISLS